MITTLLPVLGMLVAALQCVALAAAGPMLALHDRIPLRLGRRSGRPVAALATPRPTELASVPVFSPKAASDDDNAAVAA